MPQRPQSLGSLLAAARILVCLATALCGIVQTARAVPSLPSHPSPPPPAAAPQDVLVLTQADALRLATERNPGLRVAERQEREAWWAWKLAGKAPNLTLSANYLGGTTLNNYVGATQDVNVTMQQNFQPFGNTAWNGRSARHAYEAAQAALLGVRVSLAQNVKDAFTVLLFAQLLVDVARENRQLAEDLYEVTRKKFEAGAAPQMDLMNAEIQRGTAAQALISAEGAVQQARATLAPLLDLAPQRALRAQGSTELPAPTVVLDTLLETARGQHPTVLQAERTLAQSKAQVQVARTQANPSTSFLYVFDLSSLARSTRIYAFGASISVPIDWGAIHHGVHQAEEAVREKEAALGGARASISGTLANAYSAWQTALRNASTYRDSVLTPSERLLTMTRLGYTRGALNYIALLNAEQTARAARIQYLTLLQSGHQALHALEAAAGHALVEEEPK